MNESGNTNEYLDKTKDNDQSFTKKKSAKEKALELTTSGLKAGQSGLVNTFGNAVDKTDDKILINKVFNKFKNADLDAFSMLDNANKAAGTAYRDMKVNLELDQDDQLREYQSEQVLNDQQFIMLKQDSRNKSIKSIIA